MKRLKNKRRNSIIFISKDQNTIIRIKWSGITIAKACFTNTNEIHSVSCQHIASCGYIPCTIESRLDGIGCYFVKVNVFKHILDKVFGLAVSNTLFPLGGNMFNPINKELSINKTEDILRYKPKGIFSKVKYYKFVPAINNNKTDCSFNDTPHYCKNIPCCRFERVDRKSGIFIEIK